MVSAVVCLLVSRTLKYRVRHYVILFSAYLGIKDALIKKFKSFSELKKYAKVAPDPELLGKIKVCTQRLPSLLLSPPGAFISLDQKETKQNDLKREKLFVSLNNF